MKACTTNPPAKESTANSPARRVTVLRDLPRPAKLVRFASVSTEGESERATIAPRSATGMNVKKNRSSAGRPRESRRREGPPAAKAPADPAIVAAALYIAKIGRASCREG